MQHPLTIALQLSLNGRLCETVPLTQIRRWPGCNRPGTGQSHTYQHVETSDVPCTALHEGAIPLAVMQVSAAGMRLS